MTDRSRRECLAHVALCLAYVPLAVFATWPLARHAATHVLDVELLHGSFGLLSMADLSLVLWILSWDTHALVTQPTALFDANIFHPSSWSLARSDHFLGNVPFYAPVYLATGNPVLGHNLAILAYFALSGAAMYLLVWTWVRRRDIAFAAGALFALAPWRFMEGNLQAQPILYLPLIMLLVRRVVARGGVAAGIALFACLLLQSLCSVYLAALAFLVLGVSLAAMAVSRPSRVIARAVVPGLAALVCLAAVHIPYLMLQEAGDIPSASRLVQRMVSASTLDNYVRFRDFGEGRYFLSLAAFGLGLAGIASGRWVKRRSAAAAPGSPDWIVWHRASLWLAVVGFLLSLGPTLRAFGAEVPMPYRLLTELPGLGSLRGAYRFGILVTLAASGLSAFALLALRARLRPGLRVWLVPAVLGALLAEVAAHPYPMRPMETRETLPDAHRWLAAASGPGPVLELPVGDLAKDFRVDYSEARYAYLSTYHWRPLVNGYSSYPPASYELLMAIARRLPERSALQDLVDLASVRFVVVHADSLGPRERGAWEPDEPAPGLARVARFGSDSIYEVRLPTRRDFSAVFPGRFSAARTITGLSRSRLSPAGLRAALRNLEVEARLVEGLSVPARVTIENRGGRTWPGLDPYRTGLVAIRDEWIPQGASEPTQVGASRIAHDLAPGESLDVPFTMVLPQEAGRYRLRISLVQEGIANFPESSGGVLEADLTVTAWPANEARDG